MVNKDNPQAYQYYRKGWDYEQGNGVEIDISRALDYYRKAAELGSEIASYRLKTLNSRGQETEPKKNDGILNLLNVLNNLSDSKTTVTFKRENYYKYFNEVEKKIKELQNNTERIYFVNAGRMNHGKSSLFNSLAGKKELFATGDIRTTRVQSEKKFSNDIFFIDTPGLAAADNDDMEAYAAYKKADMILFIHTLRIGEFHQDEIDHINKIAKLFIKKDEFWKRFCLIFSFKDEFDDEEYEQIKNKTVRDINKYCGNGTFPVFAVSNQDYWQGVAERDSDLINYSGIVELKEFLKEKAKELRVSSKRLRKAKIEHIINKALQDLKEEKEQIENLNEKRRKNIERQHDKAKMKVRGFDQDKWMYEREINSLKTNVETLTRELAELRTVHAQDKAKY